MLEQDKAKAQNDLRYCCEELHRKHESVVHYLSQHSGIDMTIADNDDRQPIQIASDERLKVYLDENMGLELVEDSNSFRKGKDWVLLGSVAWTISVAYILCLQFDVN